MPTVIIPDKICPHCGGTKWDVRWNVYSEMGKSYPSYYCSQKRVETDGARRKRDSERMNEVAKLYRKNNWTRIRGYEEKSRKKHEKEYKEWHKRYRESEIGKAKIKAQHDRDRDELTDVYVRRRIISQRVNGKIVTIAKEVTAKQVNNYRQYLKTYRKCQQLEKQAKQAKQAG